MNKSIAGKKLLILAGADVHVKIVKAAKAMGVYTIVTDYLPLEESPAKRIADEYWMLNIMDVDAIVKKCKEERIDGVLAYCIDPAQIPYLQICEKLALPCYGTKRQFEIMTDKRLFKDFCLQNGVDVIPEYSLKDVECDNVKYPVLVKPTISRGSRGQTICWSKQDIPNAVLIARKESRNGEFLLERYMSNAQDMSFAYFITNGQPYPVKIGDRYRGNIQDNLDRQQMATVLPSKRVEEIRQNVEPHIYDMIKALGVKFGAIFLQGFYEDGHVYMYDPGLRFPGSNFDVVTKSVTGLDTMSAFVQFALTGDVTCCAGNPEQAYDYNGGACIILSLSVRPGTISAFEGFDEIAALPYVFSACKRRQIGSVVEATGDVRQRAAEFCAYIAERKDVLVFFDKVYSTIKILDENGEDMIISKVKNL